MLDSGFQMTQADNGTEKIELKRLVAESRCGVCEEDSLGDNIYGLEKKIYFFLPFN